MKFTKKVATLLIVLWMTANNTFAASDPHLETAKKLVNLFDMEQTYKQMVGPMSASTSAMIIQNQPCLAPFKEDVREFSNQIMKNVLTNQDFQEAKDAIAKIYVQHYSENELKELMAFYEKPLGKKIIKLQPEIAAQSATVGMKMVQNSMDRVNIKSETTKLLDEKIKNKAKTMDYSKMTPECRKFFGVENNQENKQVEEGNKRNPGE